MKKILRIFGAVAVLWLLSGATAARAMPLGTLLYRTSAGGQLYGYNQKTLLGIKNGLLKDIYSGHVGIYIGKEDGEDYVVEATANGVQKTLARYFVNSGSGEKFLGAKIPKGLSEARRLRVVDLAKALAERQPGYDFDFADQKGPDDGQWICVGVTEKLYESADAGNAADSHALEYNPAYYAVDITPDGFDRRSVYDEKTGDCLSKTMEYSRIAAQKKMIAPAPEIFGFDAGKEYEGERYFFLPYTQFLQPTLDDVMVDIPIESAFKDEEIRGKTPQLALLLRWSLINNTASALQLAKQAVAKLWQRFNPEAAADWLPDLPTALAADDSNDISSSNKETDKPKTLKTAVKKDSKAIASDVFYSDLPKKIASQILSKEAAAASGPASVSAAVFTQSLAKLYQPAANSQAPKTASTAKVLAPPASKLSDVNIKKNSASAANTSASVIPANSPVNYPVPAAIYQSPTPAVTNNYSTTIVSASNTESKPNLLIAQIGSDWLSLYNNGSEAIDLAKANVRLEKAKTASDPGIILRFASAEDVAYVSGSEIAAQSLYILAADTAPVTIKSQAQAIAQREDFSWTADAYTLYLAVGAVSSPDDADIIDKVGWGEAKYFSGACAAPALSENAWLSRKDQVGATAGSMLAAITYGFNSGNNCQDFVLMSPPAPDAPSAGADPDNDSDNDPNLDASDSNPSDSDLSIPAAPSSNEGQATSTDSGSESEIDLCPKILLSRIKADRGSEVLELYNPSANPIDLAACGYRVEKSQTATDPSLIARFDNAEEVETRDSTIIPAFGYYAVVAASAPADLLASADAIALRDDFTWQGSSYTLYLGRAAISSSQDPDIVDEVGWGEAKYFSGNAPAPAIPENAWLVRKAAATSTAESMAAGGVHSQLGNGFDSDNDIADWVLVGGVNDPPDFETGTEPQAFMPESLAVAGLTHLWHLDECRGQKISDSLGRLDFTVGSSTWIVGRWGCALSQSYSGKTDLRADFAKPINGNALSISFNYKLFDGSSRVRLVLPKVDYSENLDLTFRQVFTEFKGLPNTDWRVSEAGLQADGNWHQAMLVINGPEDYWALYNDGREIYRRERQGFLLPSYSSINIQSEGQINIDELMIAERPLLPAEIDYIETADLPFSPVATVLLPETPQLLGFWNFFEGRGATSTDLIRHRQLALPGVSWQRKEETTSVIQDSLYFPAWEADLGAVDKGRSWTLALRWRNSSFPDYGRSEFRLRSGPTDQRSFGFIAEAYRPYYYFEDRRIIMKEGWGALIPKDGDWHHLALSYEATDFKLSFYVDGELAFQTQVIWTEQFKPESLLVSSSNHPCELDDLSWWRGALRTEDIRALAASGPAKEN